MIETMRVCFFIGGKVTKDHFNQSGLEENQWVDQNQSGGGSEPVSGPPTLKLVELDGSHPLAVPEHDLTLPGWKQHRLLVF